LGKHSRIPLGYFLAHPEYTEHDLAFYFYARLKSARNEKTDSRTILVS